MPTREFQFLIGQIFRREWDERMGHADAFRLINSGELHVWD